MRKGSIPIPPSFVSILSYLLSGCRMPRNGPEHRPIPRTLVSVILARAPGPLAPSSRRLNFLMSQPSCPAEAGLTSPETHYQRCGLQRYSSSGGKDEIVITLNEQAQRKMRADVKLEV